MKILFLGDS